MMAIVSLFVLLLTCGSWAATCRDRFLHPFASSSIWNVAIGSDAEFVPANIYIPRRDQYKCDPPLTGKLDSRHECIPGKQVESTEFEAMCVNQGCCYDPRDGACVHTAGQPPQSFHNDQDFILRTTNQDPWAEWYDQGSWSPVDHCKVTGRQVPSIRLPYNWTTAIANQSAGQENNNGLSILLPDNRTLVQTQPAYRCQPGGPLMSTYNGGCPQPFPWQQDILGPGTWGAHGGSGLSAMGGAIRQGELSPDSPPIAHTLKLELFAHEYYFGDPNSTCYPKPSCTYAWPAVGSDAYTFSGGNRYNGSNPYLKPGALLAIPSNLQSQVNTTTVPGAKIKQALVNYGAYLVDDTACDTAAVCMQAEVTQELMDDYGINIAINNQAQPGQPFYNDLVTIFQHLHIVSNNAISRPGGGGQPLQPPAPPICGV
eukprot:m.58790 g.58790  ORF g.58790 m.58790 type:complete len:427 (-) comp13792_c0_seq1:73-1353(-)